MIDTETTIRTTAQPRCTVCNSDGDVLYRAQQDRLFNASGKWDTFRCANADCDAVWLNPAPQVEDLPLAYAEYYTHQTSRPDAPVGRMKTVYRWLKSGYLRHKYGYGGTQVKALQRWLGTMFYVVPLRRAGIDEEVRQLPARPGGLLLDVGCGSGDWLVAMRALGWKVQGLDFDDKAVACARARELTVHSGSLESQAYPADHFDVITLNHVVEHLPDALATLTECHRVLAPGGILVLYTPNSVSLGHAVFGPHWRGLEPPRHLQVFGPQSLRRLLVHAGFADCKISTANSEFYWRQSLGLFFRPASHQPLVQDIGIPTRLLSFALASLAQSLRPFNDQRGESLVAHATRS